MILLHIAHIRNDREGAILAHLGARRQRQTGTRMPCGTTTIVCSHCGQSENRVMVENCNAYLVSWRNIGISLTILFPDVARNLGQEPKAARLRPSCVAKLKPPSNNFVEDDKSREDMTRPPNEQPEPEHHRDLFVRVVVQAAYLVKQFVYPEWNPCNKEQYQYDPPCSMMFHFSFDRRARQDSRRLRR